MGTDIGTGNAGKFGVGESKGRWIILGAIVILAAVTLLYAISGMPKYPKSSQSILLGVGVVQSITGVDQIHGVLFGEVEGVGDTVMSVILDGHFSLGDSAEVFLVYIPFHRKNSPPICYTIARLIKPPQKLSEMSF